jgi:hypothetical protein
MDAQRPGFGIAVAAIDAAHLPWFEINLAMVKERGGAHGSR